MMYLVFLVGFGLGIGTTFMYVTYVMILDRMRQEQDWEELKQRQSEAATMRERARLVQNLEALRKLRSEASRH